MKKIRLVQQLFNAIEEQNWMNVHRCLAPYFMLSGKATPPMTKEEFIVTLRELGKGFPDLRFNVHTLFMDEGLVNGVMQISGTHLHDFSLHTLGVPHIPASYRHIQLPAESFEIWAEEDEISDLVILQHDEGGIKGILKQVTGAEKQVVPSRAA